MSLPLSLLAQVQFQGSIGGALTYAQAINIPTYYVPIVRPNASLNVIAPIGNSFALQSGIGYFLKGYNTKQRQDYDYGKSDYDTKVRLQYLSIPLLASFKFFEKDNLQLWVDGGMNYSLFLGGKTIHDYSNYSGDVLIERTQHTYLIKGRFTNSSVGESVDTYDVTALDVAGKLQLRAVWNKKYTFSIYHEHSLYDMRVKTDDNRPSSLLQRNTGFTIGYIF